MAVDGSQGHTKEFGFDIPERSTKHFNLFRAYFLPNIVRLIFHLRFSDLGL